MLNITQYIQYNTLKCLKKKQYIQEFKNFIFKLYLYNIYIFIYSYKYKYSKNCIFYKNVIYSIKILYKNITKTKNK